MSTPLANMGLVGLGTMGRNLARNMADHGYKVVGFDRDASAVQALRAASSNGSLQGADTPAALVAALAVPRAVMLLVPAGQAVDAVCEELVRELSPGDIIVDAGNSYFEDTERRQRELDRNRVVFLGVGVSGGSAGARHGPCIMPGGRREGYERVRPLFEAVAARAHGEPCVTWLGPGGAGHMVKMVHNGIEYAVMELIAESYDLLHRGWGFNDDELHRLFEQWSRSNIASFLIDITERIFMQSDPLGNGRLVDAIRDVARQKGTGMWTSRLAMEVGEPVPTIDAAVAVRHMSALEEQRREASERLATPERPFAGDRDGFAAELREALYAAMLVSYAQGFALMGRVSSEREYGVPLGDVARIWRGGCIIRAELLDRFAAVYRTGPPAANPLLDAGIAAEVQRSEDALRSIVGAAAAHGIPAPAFASALAYYDGYRAGRLPANLIQAQRDYFGGHTYERTDREGTFHTEWSDE